MGRVMWIFAIVMGAALALAASPADAKSKKQQSVRGTTIYAPGNYPSFRGSYNYAPSRGGGINFNDGRMGANYNPNGG